MGIALNLTQDKRKTQKSQKDEKLVFLENN